MEMSRCKQIAAELASFQRSRCLIFARTLSLF